MTVYLVILKKLIKIRLSELIAQLSKKASDGTYDQVLYSRLKTSTEQLDLSIMGFGAHKDASETIIIDEKPWQFKCVGEDSADLLSIVKRIDACLSAVHEERVLHNATREGDTVTSIMALSRHAGEFYKKLNYFYLINVEHEVATPNGIIDAYVAYYEGEDLFFPLSTIQATDKVRKAKEDFLRKRLILHKEKVEPQLHIQIDRCLEFLRSLSQDNVDAKKTGSYIFQLAQSIKQVTGVGKDRFTIMQENASNDILKMQARLLETLKGKSEPNAELKALSPILKNVGLVTIDAETKALSPTLEEYEGLDPVEILKGRTQTPLTARSTVQNSPVEEKHSPCTKFFQQKYSTSSQSGENLGEGDRESESSGLTPRDLDAELEQAADGVCSLEALSAAMANPSAYF
ncbi:MAG: hypothetical protein H0U75_01860 [Legionella sp.]|nr:hypothetical protein [Legionella sp.]